VLCLFCPVPNFSAASKARTYLSSALDIVFSPEVTELAVHAGVAS
jgi:hypothetical protein